MISHLEQEIYNTHLKTYRLAKGEPYSLRKDFSKLDEEKIIPLQKLSKFFTNYPNVDMIDFFRAPYSIYGNEQYYDLDFFTKPKALSIYTQYKKQIEMQDPDNLDTLKRLKSGIEFILNFCKEQNISVRDYEKYQTNSIPCYLDHLKNHKINFYALHCLTFGTPLVESKILEFMFSDYYGTFRKTRNKYYASKKMKEFGKKLREKLKL